MRKSIYSVIKDRQNEVLKDFLKISEMKNMLFSWNPLCFFSSDDYEPKNELCLMWTVKTLNIRLLHQISKSVYPNPAILNYRMIETISYFKNYVWIKILSVIIPFRGLTEIPLFCGCMEMKSIASQIKNLGTVKLTNQEGSKINSISL